ncbi:unnamed protein product [Phytophthora fragariaefolia]|uniref:Unnamed protein product n=1 Tax=Phytophthora fragariaefolia TaxID=1490495 RepID=A0A9W6XYP9_9STRA|nr:unnamed protein product [Phytophthora fragariaefolia]
MFLSSRNLLIESGSSPDTDTAYIPGIKRTTFTQRAPDSEQDSLSNGHPTLTDALPLGNPALLGLHHGDHSDTREHADISDCYNMPVISKILTDPSK